MKNRRMQLGIVFILASAVLIGLVVLTGCKKEPEPAPSPEPGGVASPTIEQKTCPVMGNPINKDIYTEYKGKKVYFCCPACKPDFEKDPEKFIAKLPQFKD